MKYKRIEAVVNNLFCRKQVLKVSHNTNVINSTFPATFYNFPTNTPVSQRKYSIFPQTNPRPHPHIQIRIKSSSLLLLKKRKRINLLTITLKEERRKVTP